MRRTGRRGNHEGSITQLGDGRWQARVTLDGGKRKALYGATRAEAAAKLNGVLRDRDRGLPVGLDERQTVGHYLASWLAAKKGTLPSPRTWDRYEDYVRLHLIPLIGKVALTKLTPQQVQHLQAQKLDSGLSATTVHHIRAVLHTALQDALRLGLVPRNVSELVDAPKVHRQEMKVWNAEQARTFLSLATGDRLAALYVLALSTGMRQGELFGLRWKDVDFAGASLSVITAVQRSRSAGTRLAEPKTATARRTIALTTTGSFNAVEALRGHRARQAEERLALGAAWKDMDLVFTDTVGGPLRGNNLERRSFDPLMRKAGVPRIRFHDLRHTAATLMIAAGVPVKVVSEMLGHADVGTTLRIYAHVLPNMQRDAAQVLGLLLDG